MTPEKRAEILEAWRKDLRAIAEGTYEAPRCTLPAADRAPQPGSRRGKRSFDAIEMLKQGCRNKDIAARTGLSSGHISNLKRELIEGGKL